MTRSKLNGLINFKCGTNDTTFTQEDKLVLINVYKDEISGKLAERKPRAFSIPQTVDLVASSTSREYKFPDDMLDRITKAEAMFATGDAYIPLAAIKDYAGSETESEITTQYANVLGQCGYWIRRGAMFILSGTISAVTSGLRLQISTWPADLGDLTDNTTDICANPSTTSFGFPRAFHELLARRVTIEFKGSQAKPLPLNPLEQNYEVDLERKINAWVFDDASLEIIGEPPAETSKEYGDSGWNY